MQDFPLGIPGAHQAYNAGLALSVFRQLRNTELGLSENNANEYIHPKGSILSNISQVEGLALRTTTWPGRCQKVLINENLTYFLDGAHTKESIQVIVWNIVKLFHYFIIQGCVAWFESARNCSLPTSLVFFCSPDRNLLALLDPILKAELALKDIYFTTNRLYEDPLLNSSSENYYFRAPENLHRFEESSSDELKTTFNVQYFDSIQCLHQHFLEKAITEQTQVLICGSLHLVGNFLEILNHPID